MNQAPLVIGLLLSCVLLVSGAGEAATNSTNTNDTTAATEQPTTEAATTPGGTSKVTAVELATTQSGITATEAPSTATAAVEGTTGPSSSPTAPPPTPKNCSGQRFDAASFIGGIILCGGLIAIGVFAYKFYQKRNGGARYSNF